MKILFSIGGFGRGGKERRLIALMVYLARSGHELGLIADPDSPHLSEVEGLCKGLFKYRKREVLFNLGEHRRAVREFAPDIVHSWSTACTCFSLVAVAGTAARVVSSEVTDARPIPFFSLEYLMTRLSFAFSSAVLANSRAGLKVKRAPSRKARVIYNGYDLQRLQAIDASRYAEFDGVSSLKVIMAARCSREKDFKTVLEAARLAQAEGLDILFVVAGDGPDLNDLRSAAEEVKLRNVRFTGFVRDIDNLLQHMDVGLLATDPRFHQEGIPNSLVECMAHGLPVIATEGYAISELIDEGITGHITPARDAGAILEKLRAFAADRGLSRALGVKARETIRERFEIERMGRSFVAVYKEILADEHQAEVTPGAEGRVRSQP